MIAIVILDEAYIDFCPETSLLRYINDYPNLIILQTFSKAWGLAGIRLGMAFAQSQITSYLEKIKYPYNVNEVTQKLALQALDRKSDFETHVKNLLEQRRYLESKLTELSLVEKVFKSSANFLLVRFKDSRKIYKQLIEQGIVVRDRSKLLHCENCLRITVGTATENEKLIRILKSM